MAGRYELTDQCWLMTKDIVSPLQMMGGSHQDDARCSIVFYGVSVPGAQWRDFPPWKTVYQCFRQTVSSTGF